MADSNDEIDHYCLGSPARTRTTDMLVNSQPLYRLSYWGTFFLCFSFHPMIVEKIGLLKKNFSGYIIQEQADVNNFNSLFEQNDQYFLKSAFFTSQFTE